MSEAVSGDYGTKSTEIVPLEPTSEWDPAWGLPKRAYFMTLSREGSLNITYGRGYQVNSPAPIQIADFLAMFRNGVNHPSAGDMHHRRPHGIRPRSGLSLKLDVDAYVGLIIDHVSLRDVEFSTTPIFGGYAGAQADFFADQRISPRTAFFMVRASQIVADQPRPFNIRVEAIGEFGNGPNAIPYRTPIIIDPDVRHPDGTEPPG